MLERLTYYTVPWQLVAWPTSALLFLSDMAAMSPQGRADPSLFMPVFGLSVGVVGAVLLLAATIYQLGWFRRARVMYLLPSISLLILATLTIVGLRTLKPYMLSGDAMHNLHLILLAEFVMGFASLALAYQALSWTGKVTVAAGQEQSAETAQRRQDDVELPPETRAQPSGVTFADVIGMSELKAQLREAGQKWQNRQGNGILLYGPPGTGKTFMARALAGELGLPIMTVNMGHLTSKWVGETTMRFMQIMRDAKAQAPCVLFIDEIEALLGDRGAGVSQGHEEFQRLVSAFLSEIYALRQHGGVLYIGATNLIDRIDDSAIRQERFDFRAEVGLPDTEAREGLIVSALRSQGAKITRPVLDRLVKRWNGFDVPTIINATKASIELARAEGLQAPIPFRLFYAGLRKIQGPRAKVAEGTLPLSAMSLNADLREQLTDIASTLRRIDEIEELGGSLPRGLLFYGPPGTGKTMTARAMALEAGWPILVRNGKELRDGEAVRKLKKEINACRPVIVFIDEADDILGDRTYASEYVKAATNDLLTLIDGAGGGLADVVWIAATNHPDRIDSAARRGGRFEVHVEFGPLDEAATAHLVESWLTRNPQAIPSNPGAWLMQVVPMLAGMVPADIEHTLKMANQKAINDHLNRGLPRALTVEHVAGALRSRAATV